MTVKFGILGAMLAIGLTANAALAQEQTVIVPVGDAMADEDAMLHQEAAPTRMFSVEKAVTLAPGTSRVGANLQVGGLGTTTGAGIAGGVNLRADMGVTQGLEAGLSVTGLGASGVSNLLGQIELRGKADLTDTRLGMLPMSIGAQANVGGFATGGGISNANVGLGLPITVAFAPSFNATIAPGIGYAFAAGGLLPGGASPTLMANGFVPALGLGLDWALTDRLSALIDGNVNYTSGFGGAGNLGLRYGFTEDWAADLSVGYQGNVLSALNAGTVGLGAYYAF